MRGTGGTTRVVIAALATLGAVATMAAPASSGVRAGALDKSYGPARTGVVPVDPPRDVLVGPNGDVLSLGNGNVRRLTPSGRFDGRYGTNGVAALPGLALADIHSVRLASGGVVYAAASAGAFPPAAIVVTRLDADGLPDLTLGGDGSIDYPPTWFAFNEIRTAAVTRAGRIFIGGNTDQGPATLRRIERDGSLEGSGACAGVPAVQTFPGDRIEASAYDGDRVVVAGVGIDLTTFQRGIRVRTLDGCGRTIASALVTLAPDDQFSPQWIVPTSCGWLLADPEHLVLLDRDFRIVPTFGTNGVLRWFPLGVVNVSRPAVDDRGRLLAAAQRASDSAPVLVRLDPSGQLDARFGTGGIAPAYTTAGDVAFLGSVGTTRNGDIIALQTTFTPDYSAMHASISRYHG